MRVEKEESNLSGVKSNLRAIVANGGTSALAGLCLRAVNQLPRGAPALREFRAMIRIGSHYR